MTHSKCQVLKYGILNYRLKCSLSDGWWYRLHYMWLAMNRIVAAFIFSFFVHVTEFSGRCQQWKRLQPPPRVKTADQFCMFLFITSELIWKKCASVSCYAGNSFLQIGKKTHFL